MQVNVFFNIVLFVLFAVGVIRKYMVSTFKQPLTYCRTRKARVCAFLDIGGH